MKKLFTLAALAALTSFGAQAQFTVNGTLAPAELGTGLGKYQLVSTYAGTHSVADRGLKALYMGATATTLNVFVQASAEQGSYSAITLFLDLPNGGSGQAAGTRLPGGDDNSSQLRMRPTLDQDVDVALRVTLSPLAGGDPNCYHSILNYRGTANASGRYPDRYIGSTNKTGGTFIISDAQTNIVGGSLAYQTTASGSVTANTNTGWEMSIPFASLGNIPAGSIVRAFAAYVQDNTEFTTDVIPQVAGRTTIFGVDPNFTLIAGTQSVAYEVGRGPLASRSSAAAALGFSACPNPLTASSRVAYTVAGAPQPVSIDAYNAVGQKVASLLNETQAAGPHSLELSRLRGLAAGHYVLKLQVGNQLASRHLTVE